MPFEPDYYEILQVSPEAEHEVIGAAYKKLARKYHPDLNPDALAVNRMREFNRAIEVLGDPRKRAEYDARRKKSGVLRYRPRLLGGSNGGRPETSSGRSRAVLPAALAGAAVLLGLGLISVALALVDDRDSTETLLSGSLPPATPTETPAAAGASTAPESSASAEPTPGSGTFSDGMWLVGEEMTPGVWRALRPRICSWKRLASIEGDTDVVAASGSYLTVEIPASDAAFWSDGCGWWTQILTPPSGSPTEPFGPGTWLIGEEIAPGLWQNSDSSEECRWARLSRLDGLPSSTSATGSGVAVITIQLTHADRAFDSRGCGTWTRVGE